MGEGNIIVDLIDVSANIINGEFSKGVHQTPHDPGRSGGFYPDYSFSFFLKSFPNGYKYTSLIFPWNK